MDKRNHKTMTWKQFKITILAALITGFTICYLLALLILKNYG